jgi:hypothetical protein
MGYLSERFSSSIQSGKKNDKRSSIDIGGCPDVHGDSLYKALTCQNF